VRALCATRTPSEYTAYAAKKPSVRASLPMRAATRIASRAPTTMVATCEMLAIAALRATFPAAADGTSKFSGVVAAMKGRR
jgi:hypothetical protein